MSVNVKVQKEQRQQLNANSLNSKNYLIMRMKLNKQKTVELARDYCFLLLKSKPEFEVYRDILNPIPFNESFKFMFDVCLNKHLKGNEIIYNSFNKRIDEYLDRLDVVNATVTLREPFVVMCLVLTIHPHNQRGAKWGRAATA